MSTTSVSPVVAAKGGSFLIESRTPAEVFTPEDINEEQRQMAATVAQFARDEVLPLTDEIEAKKPGVLAGLLRKAAELGFTSVDIPEEYGGLGMDKTTSTIITDHLSVLASFSTAFGVQIGIGTLPLVWYGTEEQKKRYLPRIASGEFITAYALSEATSGSDAMNVRTRATLSPDGTTYTLNGEKMWISNCGIAGLYTVFAKIDGEKFSAFLIERDSPGLTVGAEEHKLGIRGSSTCPLVLQDCKVPASNLLGEVRQRPPYRVQRSQRGPIQAGRCLCGRGAVWHDPHDPLCQGTQSFRQTDRGVWSDPTEDLRSCHSPLCHRKHGIPYRRPDRHCP